MVSGYDSRPDIDGHGFRRVAAAERSAAAGTVGRMGVWWRWDGWPTAGEWQAVWAFAAVASAVLLLYVAWRQLSGLAESNHQLAESNRLLTESNKALSRPVVSVEYSLERHASRDYTNSQNESTAFVLVRNVGTTPARDITLKVDPPFESTSDAISADALHFLNEMFSGDRTIRMLAPGHSLKYVLDSAKEAVGNDELPPEYTVKAVYQDLAQTEHFEDVFVLQMSPWAMSVAEVDPMKRISKDIQFISQSLRDRDKGLPIIAKRISER